MILRELESIINQKIDYKKAIIVLGPRQTGKTTLLTNILNNHEKTLLLNCDNPTVREQLEKVNSENFRSIFGESKVILIDEAQRVKNIGLSLKIIIDQYTDIQLLVSGSSALELSDEINEPLTGRKWEYMLYPISWSELEATIGYLKTLQQLENRLIYGMYPDVINNNGFEKEVLEQLASSYLYKDLLAYQGIRKPEILDKLLCALALQIGNEVNFNEISSLLNIDKNTVSSYINLLEKTFIIFRLNPLSRNIRSEISTSRKIYFYDNGIRNALISNFSPLDLRNDKGALWENFLISERMKFMHYRRIFSNVYFWRTTQQQEIDFIEERDGKFFAFEFKYNEKRNARFPATFIKSYPESEFQTINKENFQQFLT